jgi:hypothetical protein
VLADHDEPLEVGSPVTFMPIALDCDNCGKNAVPTSDHRDGGYRPGERVAVECLACSAPHTLVF